MQAQDVPTNLFWEFANLYGTGKVINMYNSIIWKVALLNNELPAVGFFGSITLKQDPPDRRIVSLSDFGSKKEKDSVDQHLIKRTEVLEIWGGVVPGKVSLCSPLVNGVDGIDLAGPRTQFAIKMIARAAEMTLSLQS